MAKYLLSLVLLILCTTYCIGYDEFFPSGDIYFNHYYDALAFTIGETPLNERCPGCVEYEQGLVEGSSTSTVLDSTELFDITEYYDAPGKYGLKRNPRVLDRVSLPPFAKIDFLYWGFNDTGDEVYIDTIKVFLTRYYSHQGDISKVVDIQGVNEEIPFLWLGFTYPRRGFVKTYPGLGIVNYSGVPLNPIVLDSVYMRSPLNFKSWKYEVQGDVVNMEVAVENITDQEQINIEFEHLGYQEIYSFEPFGEYIFKYSIPFTGEDFGLASIYNPNMQKECVVQTESPNSNIVGDSTPLTGVRVLGSSSKEYVGSRVLETPPVDSFCVTRIPYKLYSGEMKMVVEEQVEEKKESTSQEQSFDTPEVKGISKLPQTAYSEGRYIKYILVVGVIFLWYYLYRRFRYEN